MEAVRVRGFAELFREARARVGTATAGYGIYLDLDVLEPVEELEVGTPVPGVHFAPRDARGIEFGSG